MLIYFLRRIALTIPTFIALMFLTFVAIRMVPGDPDNFFFLDGCTDGKPANNNIPKWCNAEYNDLLVKARVIADQAERAKLYQRMQEIEHEEAPELLVAHSTVFEAMRSNVTGYKQSPLGTHTFEGVDVQ